jgi:hypothetical protein
MAVEVHTGMEKGEMKKLLVKSKQEPVNCAMAQGSDANLGLLVLDKVKSPTGLEKELKGKFADSKNVRFGTAFVDIEDNPKLVNFRINKAASGMAKRLLKTLKGTGFTKVIILLDSDGSVLEEAAGGEDAEEAMDAAAAEAPVPPAPPEPPSAPPPPVHSAADLLKALTALAGRIPQAAGADAARKAELLKLAAQGQADIKAGNLAQAGTDIEHLAKALQAAGAAGSGAAQPAAAPAAPGAVAYAKSRLAWLAARKKIETDIEKLRGEILAAYPAEAGDLGQRYTTRVGPVMAALDESLADKLDEATNATDPAQRTKLVLEARDIITRYQQFVAGESLLGDLDDNPFVPLAIRQTMTATLTALAASVH